MLLMYFTERTYYHAVRFNCWPISRNAGATSWQNGRILVLRFLPSQARLAPAAAFGQARKGRLARGAGLVSDIPKAEDHR